MSDRKARRRMHRMMQREAVEEKPFHATLNPQESVAVQMLRFTIADAKGDMAELVHPTDLHRSMIVRVPVCGCSCDAELDWPGEWRVRAAFPCRKHASEWERRRRDG